MILTDADRELVVEGLKYVLDVNGKYVTPSETKRLQKLIDEMTKEGVAILVEVDNDYHIVDLRDENGYPAWIIKHSLRCRPDLFACPFNNALQLSAEGGELPQPGKYLGSLDANSALTLQEMSNDEH